MLIFQTAKSKSLLPPILNLKLLSFPFHFQSGFSFQPLDGVSATYSITLCILLTWCSFTTFSLDLCTPLDFLFISQVDVKILASSGTSFNLNSFQILYFCNYLYYYSIAISHFSLSLVAVASFYFITCNSFFSGSHLKLWLQHMQIPNSLLPQPLLSFCLMFPSWMYK